MGFKQGGPWFYIVKVLHQLNQPRIQCIMRKQSMQELILTSSEKVEVKDMVLAYASKYDQVADIRTEEMSRKH